MNETNEKMLLTEKTLELDTATKINSDADILFEDSSKRSENTKHFRLKNGHYMAAVYDKPVHFKDPKSGEFKDLADRFREKEDCYEADTGRFKSRFPKKEGKAKFVTVERDGMSVSWRYLPKNTKRKNPEAMISRREKKNLTELLSFPRLRYEKEDTQTDLEYGISDIGIKENIILSKCPKDPIFRFELKTEGVKAVLTDDKKSVNLFENNAASGTPVFVIPPITLFDATGLQSDDAYYELTESDGMTVLSVCVNPEWLFAPERLYPVTVDPQILLSDPIQNLTEVSEIMTIRSDNQLYYTMTPKVCAGIDTLNLKNNLYTNLHFPQIPYGAIIKRAELLLHQAGYAGNDNYNVYRITSPWISSSLTWTNQPEHERTPMDSFQAQARDESMCLTLNIKPIAVDYYNNIGSNYGIVIKRDLNTSNCCDGSGNCCACNSQGYVLFHTAVMDDSYPPTLRIEYELPNDYVDHGEYETFEAGLSGEAGINLSTGQLTYRYEEVALSGGKLPLNFSHIFQSFDAEHNPNTLFGRGWFPAAIQTLNSYDYGDYFAVYRDGQGKKHYFRSDFEVNIGTGAAPDYWIGDAEGVGLLCDVVKTKVRDEKDNVMTFENGKLKTLTDAYYKEASTEHPNGCGSKMTFDYDSSGNLQTITDSMGRVLKLYYTNGRLSKMDPFFSEGPLPEGSTDVRHYAFTYNSAGKLIKITHPHEGSAAATPPSTSFAYDGNRLVMISDTRGICHTIGYDDFGRVTSVRKTGTKKLENGVLVAAENAVDGGGMDITYYDSTTVVNDSTTNVRTVYRFDDCGHTTCSYEDLRNCVSVPQEPITATQLFEYENLYHNGLSQSDKKDENMKSTGCYASLQAAVTGTDEMHPNYLANSNFSDAVGTVDPDKWIVSLQTTGCCGTECKVGGSVVNESFFEGYKSYKFDNTQYRGLRILRQEVDLSEQSIDGNMIIASAWVKAIGAIAEGTSAKFHLYAKLTYKNGASPLAKTLAFDSSNTDWQHLAIPLEIPEGEEPSAAYIQVNFTNNTGTCLVSNVRLTETRGATTNIDYNCTLTEKIFNIDKNLKRCVTSDNGIEQVKHYYDDSYNEVKTEIKKGQSTFTNYTKYDSMHQPVKNKNYYGIVTDYDYNDTGYTNYVISYHENSPDYRTLVEPQYYENSDLVKSVRDTRGYETEYTYKNSGLVESVSKTNQIVTYEYDINNRVKTLHMEDAKTVAAVQNDFSYANEFLEQVSRNGFNYNFGYDPLGRVNSVSVAGTPTVTYEYENASLNSRTTANYRNGQTATFFTNRYGYITKKQINNTDYLTAEYVGNFLQKKLDKVQNLCYNYNYYHNGKPRYVYIENNLTQESKGYKFFYYNNDNSLNYQYDSRIQHTYFPIYRKTYNANGEPIEYPEKTIIGTRLEDVFEEVVDRDYLNRPSVRSFTLHGASSPIIQDVYTYLPRVCDTEERDTTDYIKSFTHKVNGAGNTIVYEYDDAGNLIEEISDGSPIATYAYDYLNRLIEETYTTDTASKRVCYSYDNGGNLTSKSLYLADNEAAVSTTLFSYGNAWKDQLTAIGSQAITYDEIGNPLTYKGVALTWTDVNKLASYGNHTFAYNGEGARYRKDQIEYTLDGDRVLRETNGLVTLTYYYGTNGIVGFHYVNLSKNIEEDYFFGKNVHGDVVAIYDSNGSIVARYTYDAWGNIVDSCDYTTHKIGERNPIRYRGYYFDAETDLYYISGRYYDPATGKFINPADVSTSIFKDIYKSNLYCFCKNPFSVSSGSSKIGYRESSSLGCDYSGVTQVFAKGSFKKGPFFGNGKVSANELGQSFGSTIVVDSADFTGGLFFNFSCFHVDGEIGIGSEDFSISLIGGADFGVFSTNSGLITKAKNDAFFVGINFGGSVFSAGIGIKIELFGYVFEFCVAINFLSSEYKFGIYSDKDKFNYNNSLPGPLGPEWYVSIERINS